MSLTLAQAELDQARNALARMVMERDLYMHVAAVLARQALAGTPFSTMDGQVVVRVEQVQAARKSWKVTLSESTARPDGAEPDAKDEQILVLKVVEKPTNGVLAVPSGARFVT